MSSAQRPILPFSGVNPSVSEGHVRCNGGFDGDSRFKRTATCRAYRSYPRFRAIWTAPRFVSKVW
jgi:hypothetical protein